MPDGLWSGVGVALLTLFDESGALDAAGTASHAARLADLGVRGLLVAGTTGEADTLTDAERVELIGAVRAACPGVPVLAGASGAYAGPAAARTREAVEAGADAVLVAPPRRGCDLAAYYGAVALAAGGAPVLAYHFPGVVGGEVPLASLADLPIQGMKDSTGDPERLLSELAAYDGATYVGSSAVVAYAGLLGAAGAILAVANVAPEDAIAAWDGDADAQRRLLTPHLGAKTSFPHGLKSLTAARFGTSVAARLG